MSALARIALAVALGAIGASTLPAQRQMRTASDGIYSAAQADRGAARYAQSCARCHGDTLVGSYDTPSLKGQLIARWSDVGLDELSAYINHAMPMYAPGVLSPAVNADILAYILKANAFPSGPAELGTDPAALKPIRLGKPPLP